MMMPSLTRCSLTLFSLYAQLASSNLLGPRYPPPVDLTSSDSLVAAAWQNITSLFDGHVNGSAPVSLLYAVENTTFSAGLFSLHDPAAETLQYHYTSEEIRTASNGVNEVDENSLYRFASVSKLFTAYAGLIALTEEQLNTPLSTIFPELAQFQADNAEDPNNNTLYSPWDQVTPFSLMSHLSGVVGNAPPFAIVDPYWTYTVSNATNPESAISPVAYGLPPYEEPFAYFNPTCLTANSNCTAEQYIHESRARAPTFEPWTSPSYSNHGLSLLGISIAALANKTLDEVYQDALFTPLGMNSSYSLDPVDQVDRAVITSGGEPLTFFTDSGVAKASGGIYSTLFDLNKFSISILNNTLLTPEATRRWLKPLSHTASPYFSVGAPWEIHRVPHSNGVVTDLYTKLGDSGFNGGAVVIIPEYNAGFNLIDASSLDTRSAAQAFIFDAIVKQLLPALEAQAAAEASKNLAKTYVSTDPDLNSTVTLEIDPLVPGISITQWISNSSDILENQVAVFANVGGLRLLPSIVDRDSSKWAFRILKINNETFAEGALRAGPLTWQIETNWDWALSGQRTYAGNPLNLAYFEVDEAGTASVLELPAFKVRLESEV